MTDQVTMADLIEILHWNLDWKRNQDRLKVLRSQAEKTTQALNSMPKSATPDHTSLERSYIKLIEARDEIINLNARMVELRPRAQAAIEERLVDQTQKLILTYRYIFGWTWPHIAAELSLSRSHLNRLHRAAKIEFDKLIAKATKPP